MKDEIINNIKADLLYCYEDSYSTKEEYKKELDYITNLQDRIKELETINEEHRKLNGNLRTANSTLCEVEDFMYDQAKEYKSRIDKAIEYIKEYACYDKEFNMCCDDLWTSGCDEVIDILKGESDE